MVIHFSNVTITRHVVLKLGTTNYSEQRGEKDGASEVFQNKLAC